MNNHTQLVASEDARAAIGAAQLISSTTSSALSIKPLMQAMLAAMPFALPLFGASFSTSALAQTPQAAIVASQVLITATRNAQLSSDVLADHDVINEQEILASGHSSLSELLMKKRGFEITSNGGPANNSSVFMRGTSNAQSIVLIDGVRVGAATSGGPVWSSIPLAQIERIEIVYGPLSSLYGADAMGGVVQIFTKKGGNYFAPTISIGAGSRGLRKFDLGFSGASAGAHALRYAFNAAHEEESGFSATKPGAGKYSYNPDRDGYARDSFNASLSYVIATGHEIGVSALRSRQNSMFDAGPSYDDRDVSTLETRAIYSKNQWTKEWASQFNYNQSEDRTFSDASYGMGHFDTKRDLFSWQNDIALGKNTLQLVAEHRTEKVGSSEDDLNKKRTTRSFAGAYQWKLDQHLATLSLRNDNISGYGGITTGSVAYGYRFNKQWRISTSYGTSFRAPSFNELYYPSYGIATNRAEKGKNLELGLVYDNGDTHFTANLFRNRITDLLVYASTCPVSPEIYLYGCSTNLNKAQLTGLSLGGNTTLTESLFLRGSLDWQQTLDQTTNLRLPRRARQHGSLALEYAKGDWTAGVESTFSSRRFDDVNNKNPLGGYAVWNLYGSYAVAKHWQVQARWNNVLNKDYEFARNYQTAGSNLFIGLRYGD